MKSSNKVLMPCALMVGVAMQLALPAFAAGIEDPSIRAATQMTQKQLPVLLDINKAGHRLVAVGERGIVIYSDDHGKNWKQAKVPVSVTLTRVRFSSPDKGWIVGHSGVVLRTQDAGASWVKLYDGVRAAKAISDQASIDQSPQGAQRQKQAEQFIRDGADKPFLTVDMQDDRRGIILGAYGLIFATEDDGQTWVPWLGRMPNPKGLHLYALHREGDALYVAGEQGFFSVSRDSGQSFKTVETPYRGSFFTIAQFAPGKLILAGLRGNAYLFDTHSNKFQKLDVPIPVTLTTSARLANNSLVFINQAGNWLVASEDKLTPLPTPPGAPANGAVLADDGAVLAATWRGIVRINSEKGKP